MLAIRRLRFGVWGEGRRRRPEAPNVEHGCGIAGYRAGELENGLLNGKRRYAARSRRFFDMSGAMKLGFM